MKWSCYLSIIENKSNEAQSTWKMTYGASKVHLHLNIVALALWSICGGINYLAILHNDNKLYSRCDLFLPSCALLYFSCLQTMSP